MAKPVYTAVLLACAALAGCSPAPQDTPVGPAAEQARPGATTPAVEIMPGLTKRVLAQGRGPAAEPGQTVSVHYTGWLYDPSAPDHRGRKFDSSVDRGEYFKFELGAGRVIKGWDQGVTGMTIGEISELTIAPELGYGKRGAGGVIPPDATLVFEVELAGLDGPDPPR